MTRTQRMWVVCAAVAGTLTMDLAAQQTRQPPAQQQTRPQGQRQQNPPPVQRPNAGRGARALPPITANMTPAQLQAHMDAWALIEAERRLQLSKDQMPNFLLRMSRLQEIRRQYNMERRKLLGELNALANSTDAKDEALLQRMKAFDDASERLCAAARKALDDMDAVLTPMQRVRFRLFEEAVERQKIDLLSKIR